MTRRSASAIEGDRDGARSVIILAPLMAGRITTYSPDWVRVFCDRTADDPAAHLIGANIVHERGGAGYVVVGIVPWPASAAAFS